MLSWGFHSQVNQWSATWRISQSNVGASCNSELVFLLQLPTQIYLWVGLQTEALDKCFQVVAVVVLVILVVLAVFKALPKSGCQHYPQFSWIVVKQTIKRTFWVRIIRKLFCLLSLRYLTTRAGVLDKTLKTSYSIRFTCWTNWLNSNSS